MARHEAAAARDPSGIWLSICNNIHARTTDANRKLLIFKFPRATS